VNDVSNYNFSLLESVTLVFLIYGYSVPNKTSQKASLTIDPISILCLCLRAGSKFYLTLLTYKHTKYIFHCLTLLGLVPWSSHP